MSEIGSAGNNKLLKIVNRKAVQNFTNGKSEMLEMPKMENIEMLLSQCDQFMENSKFSGTCMSSKLLFEFF